MFKKLKWLIITSFILSSLISTGLLIFGLVILINPILPLEYNIPLAIIATLFGAVIAIFTIKLYKKISPMLFLINNNDIFDLFKLDD